METNYEMLYNKIVKGSVLPEYKGPEKQGNMIEKCSILKPIEEIEYSGHSKIKNICK